MTYPYNVISYKCTLYNVCLRLFSDNYKRTRKYHDKKVSSTHVAPTRSYRFMNKFPITLKYVCILSKW